VPTDPSIDSLAVTVEGLVAVSDCPIGPGACSTRSTDRSTRRTRTKTERDAGRFRPRDADYSGSLPTPQSRVRRHDRGDEAVVVDGHHVSSRSPADLPHFMAAVLRILVEGPG